MRQSTEASGIKVLDRSVAIIRAVADGEKTLAQLSDATALPRATAHRLATALETHEILARTETGAWVIGPAISRYAASVPSRIIEAAKPVMAALVSDTNESVQLYELTGTTRTCIAALEPPSGLNHTVPVGSQLPLDRGSAAKVYTAFGLVDAPFEPAELTTVRETKLAESVNEREVGLASVSTPIKDRDGKLVAVLSVSGPTERLKPSPAEKWGSQLLAAADDLMAAL